jgi:2-polyprenyl-3-methyl-5-hydroxy-6-metoxy-1,4-benzoquinol methylase
MNCYLCQSPNLEIILTKLRGDVKRETWRCCDCSLTYLAPKKAEVEKHYRSEYRDTNSPMVGKTLNSKEIFDIYLPFQKIRVDRIRHLLRRNMRVLDIGASSGHFLFTLKKHVGECAALELNQKDAEFMRRELGFTVYDTPIENADLPTEYFDLITVFQTLEHIDDPISFLQAVRRHLKPNGYLVVEVPNEDEALYTVYHSQSYSDFNHKEAHLFYYTGKTLRKVLGKAGFRGKIQSIQRVNFLNHLHWLFTGKPQAGPHIHMAPARLVEKEDSAAARELNAWMKKTDAEYRQLLNKYNLGDSLLFIGQKK